MHTLENIKSLKKRKQIKNIFNNKNVRRKGIKYSHYNNLSNKKKEISTNDNITTVHPVIKITGFFTVNELSNMIGVSSANVMHYCISLGVMVTLNKILDLELFTLIAYKFGYIINFIKEDIYNSIKENIDSKNGQYVRPPIVTVMGHIDHGKTSLLDYIRKTNLIEKESGGITQHIGIYNVEFKNGKSITFIDTPGHEAFTSMRSRGAKITDIIIIVIDADDDVMPQTKEAISHANTASLPIIFALNKIDKPTAQPDKIRKQLANMNILVEEWGGKYQSQEISTKTGVGIEQLLEKIWLEAEMLELIANQLKPASGTVIESSLDKSKGYITNILVQDGTIKLGDFIYSGGFHGKIKTIYDQNKLIIREAGPSKPIFILGLNGPPISGEKFKVCCLEKGTKKKIKRKKINIEQKSDFKKNITFDEINYKMALTNIKEINIILKGDVVGSVEALTNAIQSISTEEVSINIINKGIGLISESDVLLASVSNAIIIGFNVKSTINTHNIYEHKNIDIRLYSVIYDAINDIKNIVNLIHSPRINGQVKVLGKAEIRNIYNIKKIYTIAGCMVTYGKIYRHNKIRLLREGVVFHQGELASLKRFKEDIKEVLKGYECGLHIKDYNDIKVGDIIEFIEEIK